MDFKARLKEGHQAIGWWLELQSPIAAEVMAGAGYDCVLIDQEHGPGGILDAIHLMQAMAASPLAPLLRVSANDAAEIKRALDAGVHGVMIPVIESGAEAEAAVAACRYPPEGIRGMAAPIVRASGYGRRWRDYVKEANEQLLIMCQIESRAGIEAVEEIAEVPGVDMLFIGPFDLSANMGHMGEPDHPEVRAAIGRAEQAAREAGKLLGGIQTPERGVDQLAADGYALVLSDVDTVLLRDAAESSVARWRALVGR